MEKDDPINESIYEPAFVRDLFNDMSKTYDNVNYITSFGFSKRWRRQCVNAIPLQNGDVVADLLTGMGECWEFALKRIGSKGKIIALDFSDGMLSHAHVRKKKLLVNNIDILCEDVFSNTISDHSVSSVMCGFGIKTFSKEQIEKLAIEIKRILIPGGYISMIDISVPENVILKTLYMFYLKKVIPILGLLFLGKPETYTMLGIYTDRFQNAQTAFSIFSANGFQLQYLSYFNGCASGFKGTII